MGWGAIVASNENGYSFETFLHEKCHTRQTMENTHALPVEAIDQIDLRQAHHDVLVIPPEVHRVVVHLERVHVPRIDPVRRRRPRIAQLLPPLPRRPELAKGGIAK